MLACISRVSPSLPLPLSLSLSPSLPLSLFLSLPLPLSLFLSLSLSLFLPLPYFGLTLAPRGWNLLDTKSVNQVSVGAGFCLRRNEYSTLVSFTESKNTAASESEKGYNVNHVYVYTHVKIKI